MKPSTDSPAGQVFLLLLMALVPFILMGCAPASGLESSPESDLLSRPDSAFLHPDFELSLQSLSELLDQAQAEDERSILPGIRAAILEKPQAFLDLMGRILAQDRGYFVRADKEVALGPDYEPDDILGLNPFRRFEDGQPFLTLNRNDLSLRSVVLPDLFAMVQAARQDGVVLDISSSYRSYQYQVGLFQRWVNELGLEEAERVSARPGSSQHQLGTTLDFGSVSLEFEGARSGRWMREHASRFGFSLSYPSGMEWLTGYDYEPWHFRWLGRDALRLQDEFFQGSQFRTLLFLESSWDAFAAARS